MYTDPSGEVIDYSQKLTDKNTDREYYKAEKLTHNEAFDHYKLKSGVDLQVQFSEIVANDINISKLSSIKNLISKGEIGTYSIDEKIAVSTQGESGLIFGNITSRIQGELTISEGKWEFQGTQKYFDDVYDFGGSQDHRSILGNALTIFGNSFEGKEFNIQIRGSKDILHSGSVNNVKPKQQKTNYLKSILDSLTK